MSNQLARPSNRRLRRLTFRPLADVTDIPEEDATLKVPVSTPEQGNTVSGLLTVKLGLQKPRQFIARPSLAIDSGEIERNDDPGLGKLSTIPMMVLTGIANEPDQKQSTLQSEISGAAGIAGMIGALCLLFFTPSLAAFWIALKHHLTHSARTCHIVGAAIIDPNFLSRLCRATGTL